MGRTRANGEEVDDDCFSPDVLSSRQLRDLYIRSQTPSSIVKAMLSSGLVGLACVVATEKVPDAA